MSLLVIPLSRRQGLIYLLLALAETAWLFTLVLNQASPNAYPVTWFLTLLVFVALAILLGWLTDVYRLPFGFARILGMALALFGILTLVRLALYPQTMIWQLNWLGQFLRLLFINPTQVITPLLWILLTMGYVWWRCLPVGQTPPEPHIPAFTLQIGFLGFTLALILGALEIIAPPPLSLIILFVTCSLLTMSLSYTQTIVQYHGEAAVGPVRLRLANGGVTIIIIALLTLLLTAVFSFPTLQTIFQLVFTLIGFILKPLIALFVWFLTLLSPLIETFFAWLQSLAGELPEQQVEVGPAATREPFPEIRPETEPAWWSRYLLLGWRTLLVLAVVWLFYHFMGRRRSSNETDQAGTQQTQGTVQPNSPGLAGLWDAGKNKLADLMGLVRQFGVGHDLRAAVTIRRIYAALILLADQNGLQRPPSQTPSEFLTTLSATWPDLAPHFSTITEAYIYVHYGQLPEGQAGVAAVQEAWQAVYLLLSEGQQPVGASS